MIPKGLKKYLDMKKGNVKKDEKKESKDMKTEDLANYLKKRKLSKVK